MSKDFSRRQLLAGILAALCAPWWQRPGNPKQALPSPPVPPSPRPAPLPATGSYSVISYSYDGSGSLCVNTDWVEGQITTYTYEGRGDRSA